MDISNNNIHNQYHFLHFFSKYFLYYRRFLDILNEGYLRFYIIRLLHRSKRLEVFFKYRLKVWGFVGAKSNDVNSVVRWFQRASPIESAAGRHVCITNQNDTGKNKLFHKIINLWGVSLITYACLRRTRHNRKTKL